MPDSLQIIKINKIQIIEIVKNIYAKSKVNQQKTDLSDHKMNKMEMRKTQEMENGFFF